MALAALAMKSDKFFTADNLLNQGRLMAEVGLVALAMTFVIVTGGIDLSVGSILGFTACGIVSKWGLAGLNHTGPHGFSEVLYAFSSATGNNGSAFAGLTANTPWYNLTLAFAMLIGRFLMIVPIMALAGSLVQKKTAPPGAGTFPVTGATFVLLLTGTVVLIGALNFLPALALGPIVEHFLNLQGQLF